MSDIITIEVNGKPIEAKVGSMLIEVTDANDIEVPRFCYHKKLSIAANCRMCLVEVEKAPKPLPACATPVMDGMKVWTRSPTALAAQKDTMEFLLINHPLDCPICDQGGECELQDVSVAYGGDESQYFEIKRITQDKNIGPLISTDLTRCIQCTRCVRFGEEIAGMRELGMIGRGDREQIATFAGECINSELSGNAVDVCPVGALTMKPSRYTARAWEIVQAASIAPHDSVGSNVFHHTFQHKVMRSVPNENDAINECWLSDRDRFSYEGLYTDDRLEQPMLKKGGEWKAVSWDEALEATAKVLQECDKENAAVLASPNSTLEELYLLQKSMRAVGINSIDHRLRQTDFSAQEAAPLFPWLGMSIEALEEQNAVLLVGTNIRYDQPMANHRIRKAALNGAQVMTVNPCHIEFNYDVVEQCVTAPVEMVNTLAAIAKASGDVPTAFADIDVSDQAQTIADNLKKAENALVLLGNMAVQHPDYANLQSLSSAISKNTGAIFGSLAESANTAGAWMAGAVPHRIEAANAAETTGKSAFDVLNNNGTKTFVLLGVEPEFDCENPQQAVKSLSSADNVIAISSYANNTLKNCATILLPSSQIVETSGTFVNMEGTFQSFTGVSKLLGEARPAWKILRVLGNMLDVEGFDYMSSEEVRDELKATIDATGDYSNDCNFADASHIKAVNGLQRIGEVQMYAGDALVRRANSLQQVAGDQRRTVTMNPADVNTLGLASTESVSVTQGDTSVLMGLLVDDVIPVGSALIPAGTQKSAELGSAFGVVNISKG